MRTQTKLSAKPLKFEIPNKFASHITGKGVRNMLKMSAHLLMRVVGSISAIWTALALHESYVQMWLNVGLNSSAYSSVLSYKISCKSSFVRCCYVSSLI